LLHRFKNAYTHRFNTYQRRNAISTITKLGKELRKLRLERGITLFEMAETIGLSSSLLSSVETGKKPATKSLVAKLAEQYPEVQANRAVFDELGDETQKEVRFRLENEAPGAKELALVFARNFNSLASEDVQRLLEVFAPKKGIE
jgi:HTH-type transcriptional regulator, competence development regulator